MLPVFIIAFREFLEAFLSVSVLLSISSKFNLHRAKGILSGTFVGFACIFVLATVVFGADTTFIKHLAKSSFDLFEGWLSTISSIFVAYAVFSLHRILAQYSQDEVKTIEKHVGKYKTSYWLLPFTAFLFVFKEGCEAVFFNVTNGLFYTFSQDLSGFGLAFIAALTVGIVIQKFLTRIALQRIFRITEVYIIYVGINAFTGGLRDLSTYYFQFNIGSYSMLLALLYVVFVYEVFIRGSKKVNVNESAKAVSKPSKSFRK